MIKITINIKNSNYNTELESLGEIEKVPWINPYDKHIYDSMISPDVVVLDEGLIAESVEKKSIESNQKDRDVDLSNIKSIEINGIQVDNDSFSRITINSSNKEAKLDVDSRKGIILNAGDVIKIVF
mgnify:CR=1 FL=1